MNIETESESGVSGVTTVNYVLHIYEEEMRPHTSFSAAEKRMLRPIAETLAMLDGNAFFGISDPDVYESYLSEAWALFDGNGGEKGWAGASSWLKEPEEHQIPAVRAAWENYQSMLNLCRNNLNDDSL